MARELWVSGKDNLAQKPCLTTKSSSGKGFDDPRAILFCNDICK